MRKKLRGDRLCRLRARTEGRISPTGRLTDGRAVASLHLGYWVCPQGSSQCAWRSAKPFILYARSGCETPLPGGIGLRKRLHPSEDGGALLDL